MKNHGQGKQWSQGKKPVPRAVMGWSTVAKSLTLKFILRGTFDEECQLWFDRSSVWFNGKLSKCLFKKARNNAEEPTVRWSNQILGHAVVTVRPDGVPSTAAVTKRAACYRHCRGDTACTSRERTTNRERLLILYISNPVSPIATLKLNVFKLRRQIKVLPKKKNASEIIT